MLADLELSAGARPILTEISPAERRRLLVLVRTGRGRRSRLTPGQRGELESILFKLAPRQLMGDAVDRLSPLHLPRRLLYGRAAKP